MNRFIAAIAAVLSFSTASFGKEPYVQLTNYVMTAEAICVCTVEKDNGDNTVTVQVDQVLKGELDKSEVLKGDTGHCWAQGPVSRFMKQKKRYLVFLFKDNTVGRLGGILSIQDQTLHARFIDGFNDIEFDKENHISKLPLGKAIGQITELLKKNENVQQSPERDK